VADPAGRQIAEAPEIEPTALLTGMDDPAVGVKLLANHENDRRLGVHGTPTPLTGIGLVGGIMNGAELQRLADRLRS
jgi:hypothetical protein